MDWGKIKSKIFKTTKKLVPGLVLFSLVATGIFTPLSFPNDNFKLSVVSANDHEAFQEAEKIAAQNREAELIKQGKTKSEAEKQAATEQQAVRDKLSKNTDDNPFNCNIFTGSGFKNCIGSIVYYLFFVPATYILTLSGWLFDITMAFTLSANILDSTFAREGWVVTRDLANMFFIFILLYIAIATILDIAGYNAKALLAKLIVVALLLNFSLFASRVVIDASNILALAFYDSISAPARAGDIGQVSSLVKFFDVKPKGISSGLVSFFNPQKLLGTSPNNAKDIVKFAENDTGKLVFIYLFSAVIILTAAWAFFSVAFLFITRTAILWFLMATAPIAFAAMVLPKTKNLFDKWWGELISKSFCVAVFLFFLWLITKFAQYGIFKDISSTAGKGFTGLDSSNNFLFVAIIILLQFSILLVLILVAKQQTQKMCGAVAGFSMNFVSNLGTKAAGFLAGGVGGLALRNTLGQYAYKKAEEWNKAGYGGGGLAQRLQLQAARKISSAGFDVRATKLGGEAELGDASGKKGYAGWIKERTAKDVAFAKSFGKGRTADETRATFAKNLKGMGIISRMVTGRGILSTTQQKKAYADVDALVKAADKITREENKLDELTEKLLGISESNPLEIEDESGVKRKFNGITGEGGLSEAVRKKEFGAQAAADKIDEMVRTRSDELTGKLDEAKARSAKANRQRSPDELARDGRKIAKEIEEAARELAETERMLEWSKEIKRLDERKRDRERQDSDRAERNESQRSAGGGGEKGSKK